MIIFYAALLLIIIFSLRYTKYNNEYLSYETTNIVKGVFILLVFIKHATPYIAKVCDRSEIGGDLFWFIDKNVGQWIVAMFLFYSGYGIMESIRKKGSNYIETIPKKRILNVLVNFDIAVLLFIIVALFVGTPLTVKQIIMSFTGWDSVGNSNWYIFIILICYAIAFISFYKQKSHLRSAFLCLILCLASIFILSYYKQEYWYNTMLCFCAGIYFSILKNEDFILKRYWYILSLTIICLVILNYSPFSLKGLTYNAKSIVFCAMIILLTMKLRLKSNTLLWCGKNLFPLYIYQRIPMIILANVSGGLFITNYPISYTLSCLVITVLIALLYKYWAVKL